MEDDLLLNQSNIFISGKSIKFNQMYLCPENQLNTFFSSRPQHTDYI